MKRMSASVRDGKVVIKGGPRHGNGVVDGPSSTFAKRMGRLFPYMGGAHESHSDLKGRARA